MTPLYLFDATTWTPGQIAQVIREQLAIGYDTLAGQLRSAVMFCPRDLPAQMFVDAAVSCGVNAGTARNRYHEVRRWQRELGEVS